MKELRCYRTNGILGGVSRSLLVEEVIHYRGHKSAGRRARVLNILAKALNDTCAEDGFAETWLA